MIYDRMVFGMHHLNITQTGAGYGAQSSLSHVSYELDLAGEDNGVDYFFNKMPNTCFRCTGRFGTKATGNTHFFVTCDASGTAKKVLCADGNYRIITLALTHSNVEPQLGKVYRYNEVIYQEGTAGQATGNHIHLECCEGLVTRKVVNVKGFWNLPDMLDARKVFWILDGWTTVISTHGLTFNHCREVPIRGAVMEKGKLYFVADKAPCRIRQKLTFSGGKPTGAILATMPKGSFAEITHMTNRHEQDAQGFEWFQVAYVTVTGDAVAGYVQGDLSAYIIKRG